MGRTLLLCVFLILVILLCVLLRFGAGFFCLGGLGLDLDLLSALPLAFRRLLLLDSLPGLASNAYHYTNQ